MEKINARKVLAISQKLGLTYSIKKCKEVAQLANQECQQSSNGAEPETVVSFALLAVARENQKYKRPN